jgi:hypothetical protein
LVVVFAMDPAIVGLSAMTTAVATEEMGAAATAVAPALLNPVPMGADADSARFAAMCAAAGAAHVAVAEEHGLERGLYSGAQSLAMTTAVATEAMRAAAATI